MVTRLAVLASVALLVVALPAQALVGYVAEPKAKGLVLWRSSEAWSACSDEQKATGRPGVICGEAMVAVVENCTKASYLGSGEGWILGSAFRKVRILEGNYAGAVGLVFREQWHDEKDEPCNAPRLERPKGDAKKAAPSKKK